jgi:endonuclease/exonuclease/phosphatase family metal-dependent hydrolase
MVKARGERTQMAGNLKVGTWNVAWRIPSSAAAATMRERLFASDLDVACLTEAAADFLDGNGHVETSSADYGYPLLGNRRKVLLWSKQPWEDVDILGDPHMPPGRFIAGRTQTAMGPVLFIGVCIPWSAAHVSTGRQDRTRWEDHLAYLSGLECYLSRQEGPFVVLGDFNQAIPRRRAPRHVFNALQAAVLGKVNVFTADEIEGHGYAIDHVCGSGGFECEWVSGLSAFDAAGKRLSDHFGLTVNLGRSK